MGFIHKEKGTTICRGDPVPIMSIVNTDKGLIKHLHFAAGHKSFSEAIKTGFYLYEVGAIGSEGL